MLVTLSIVLCLSALLGSGEEERLLSPLSDTSLELNSETKLQDFRKALPSSVPRCKPPENTTSCSTNFKDELKCVGERFFLIPCYCLSDNHDYMAHCQYTCFRKEFLIAPNLSSLLEKQCSPFNRSGNYCGKCKNGTASPAFSFSLKCVECKPSWRNTVKYVAVAYIPLLVFIGVLIAFRVSVNTAPLLGFILVAQTCTIPFQTRLAVGLIEGGYTQKYQAIGVHFLISVYGIWNLDFFRTVIPNFCLGLDWNFIHLASLDYIIASCPFIAIIMIYTIIELYSRGYWLFRWWRPLHWCLSRLKNEMNIKTPLVDAFGTFFSISYAKTLYTTFDMLSITETWNSSGSVNGHVSYYASSEGVKTPYIALGLTMFAVFNVLPIFVLFIYSFKAVPANNDESQSDTPGFFRPLLESLLAPYKDGQNGTCNCRWFSVVYLLVRILLIIALLCSPNIYFQFIAAILFLIVGATVAVVKPYKSDTYNTVDTALMFSLSIAYMTVLGYFFTNFIAPLSVPITVWLISIMCCVPFVIFVGMIAYYIIFIRRLPHKGFQKCTRCVSGVKSFLCLQLQRRRGRRSPQHDIGQASVSSRGTMYVIIESGTVRVNNVDLCN